VELTPAFRKTRERFEEATRIMTKQFYRGFAQEEIDRFELQLERILKNSTPDHAGVTGFIFSSCRPLPLQAWQAPLHLRAMF